MKFLKLYPRLMIFLAFVSFSLLFLPGFQDLKLIIPGFIFSLVVLNFLSETMGFNAKPRNMVVLFYGGFAVLIGGGIFVAALSLNPAFFAIPCLIGIPMIFLGYRIKILKNARKTEI